MFTRLGLPRRFITSIVSVLTNFAHTRVVVLYHYKYLIYSTYMYNTFYSSRPQSLITWDISLKNIRNLHLVSYIYLIILIINNNNTLKYTILSLPLSIACIIRQCVSSRLFPLTYPKPTNRKKWIGTFDNFNRIHFLWI